jgi:type I restriction enzyme S subunit
MSENEQLPPGWVVADLEDVFDILDGRRVPVNARERAKRVGNIPYYGATGRVGWIDDYLFDEELVLLGEDGAPFFDKARHVAYLIGGKSWVNNHAHVLRPCGGLTGSLFAHQLNVIDYHAYVGGTTRWKLNQAPMRKIQLKIPPSKEQERIADVLDELLSDLDAGVAALERVRDKLKLYRASVLKAAMEGALTAEWRKQHPQVEPASQLLNRILAERRRRWDEDQLRRFKEMSRQPPKNWEAKYREPVPPETSRLPVLPDSWCWASLDQLSLLVTSGSRGWKKYYSDKGAVFIRSQDISHDRLELDNAAHVAPPKSSEGVRTLVQCGDLLVTITGANVAKAAIVNVELPETYVSQHVGLIRFVTPRLRQFIHMYTVAPSGGRKRLLALAYGAGKPGLNLDNLRELPIPLPPESEWEAIVEIVEGQLSVTNHLETDIEGMLKNTLAFRQASLRHAFTGNLVPQDPNNEPASELLERIAAEREKRAREAATAKRLTGLRAPCAPTRESTATTGITSTKEATDGRIPDR